MKVTLHAEFNCFKEEGMGEDQTEGRIGHEACHYLSPGTYKYYFVVNGRRRSVATAVLCFSLVEYLKVDFLPVLFRRAIFYGISTFACFPSARCVTTLLLLLWP